jgi:hypothetical protein
MPFDDQLQGRAKLYTIAQVVMSSLGLLISFVVSFIFFVMAFLGLVNDPQSVQQNSTIMVIAWTSLLIGLLFFPGLFYSILRLQRKKLPVIPDNWNKRISILLIIIWLLCLIITLISSNWSWTGFLNAIFVVPLVTIPLLFLVKIGSHKLSTGSPNRTWGIVSFNFFVTMPFILFVEVLVFILVLLVIGVWLLNQPELFRQIIQYSEQLSLGQLEPQIAEELLIKLFKNPAILNGSIFIIAFLVPLIEEFFKPMALWFLAGRKLTPSQGFVGGLIAGACFATLETLGAIGSPSDTSWFFLLIGRMGTGLLHVTLSGLVGWGLASVFYNRNWGRFFGNYFSAVLIHGLWNLFALLSGITPLLPFSDEIGNLPIILSQLGPFVLLSLAFLMISILLQSNRKLQKQSNN